MMRGWIEEYGLIGDCETAALVGRDGSIDWLCWPRFDSDACFAALLGDPSNGRWKIAPVADSVTITRRYRPNSLILETVFETADGRVRLVDFMPPRGEASDLIRILIGERGQVSMRVDLTLRFGYGRVVPWVTTLDDGTFSAVAGPDRVVLRTPVDLHGEGMTTTAEFIVEAGETVPFVMTQAPSHLEPPRAVDATAALADTEAFWSDWIGRTNVSGIYADPILRSMITLKALTHAPTGGIIAAATTSLPEQPGGVRNWDYRYCWIRDATLTLLALMNAGCFEEALAWRDWLLRAVAGAPEQMQIMYGLGGERRLMEWVADWLPGYEGATPVRIGNAAHNQFQLDVYGELMDALHQARKGGLPPSAAAWEVQKVLMDHVEATWDQPDDGMWEVRGERRHFTFSKVMAWVAVDRAVKGVEMFDLDGPVDRWRILRDRMHAEICQKGFDTGLGSFTQAFGRPELDASLLLLASVGFLEGDDPRYRGTVEVVERVLMRDGLLLRYDSGNSDDGLPEGEGAFLACSFWLVDAWLLTGRRAEAEALFERLLALRNDLGLLAEEYDPVAGRLTGNFPQAFSHVGLVNSAFNLTHSIKPVHQRADRDSSTGDPDSRRRSEGRVAPRL
ncbi:glycoside hydrolase family 15 protein [uncultured Brevundimonas sp.]|uniref:glycoside hydrolase family 15 protein n=1 Tax=uncultured Brevundimonas sp. TaxID=213418 RepID=UPI0030EDB78A|tara:strand:+ start:7397 stop:9256 length:1860 start_codon:yes stop_codon:yes gene_type:complete